MRFEDLFAGAVSDGFDHGAMTASLAALGGDAIAPHAKGMPAKAGALRLADVHLHKWNLLAGDLPAPVAFLRQSALEANSLWMQNLRAVYGVEVAPHSKTTMSPQLFAHQAARGSFGVTVANVQQAAVASDYGCRRIILANQIVGRAQIEALAALLDSCPGLEIHAFVDSAEIVRALEEAAATTPALRRLGLLLEIGVTGGRTGCRTLADADRVLDAILASSLSLTGVAGYEGLIAAADGAEDAETVRHYFDRFEEVAQRADARSAFADGPVILTAGGSSYFDVVCRRLERIALSRPAAKVLRSGCYLTHDNGTYEDHQRQLFTRAPGLGEALGELEPALFVSALVQSVPEPDLAILTLGKRDVGIDIGLPRPLWRFRAGAMSEPQPIDSGAYIFKLNDQHSYLRIPAGADVRVGDLVGVGVSHPCTTFDRWRYIHVLDDDWNSVGAVATFF